MARLAKSHPKLNCTNLLRGHLIRQAETFDTMQHSMRLLTMISTSSKDPLKQFLFTSILEKFHSLPYPLALRQPIFPDYFLILYDTDNGSSAITTNTVWPLLGNLLTASGRLDPVFIFTTASLNSQSYKAGWFLAHGHARSRPCARLRPLLSQPGVVLWIFHV